MVAGIASGYLADKYGRHVLCIGLWVYLGGCILGTFLWDIKWALSSCRSSGWGRSC